MKAMFNHAFLYQVLRPMSAGWSSLCCGSHQWLTPPPPHSQVFIPTYTSGHYSFMMSSDTINPAVTKVLHLVSPMRRGGGVGVA